MILSQVTPRLLWIWPDTDSSEFHSEPASRMADLVEHGGAYNLQPWIYIIYYNKIIIMFQGRNITLSRLQSTIELQYLHGANH